MKQVQLGTPPFGEQFGKAQRLHGFFRKVDWHQDSAGFFGFHWSCCSLLKHSGDGLESLKHGYKHFIVPPVDGPSSRLAKRRRRWLGTAVELTRFITSAMLDGISE